MKRWSFVSSLTHDGHVFSIGSRFANTVLVGIHDETSFGINLLRYWVPVVLLPKETQSIDSSVVCDHVYRFL